MTIAVYPGSFDPVTNGHLDIAARATRLFDTVIMAVFDRPNKNLLFNTADRLEMLHVATRDMPGIKIDTYSTLTVDYARSVGASVIMRGLRGSSDFEHEFRLAQIYRTVAADIDVIVFMSDPQYTFFSSSTVREIASLGGDVSWLAPDHVVTALKRVYSERQK